MTKSIDDVNELLGLCLAQTFRADELKGWRPSPQDNGVTKFYIDSADCQKLSEAFAKIATELKVQE